MEIMPRAVPFLILALVAASWTLPATVAAEEESVLTDPEGDVALMARSQGAEQNVPLPGSGNQHYLDLTALHVEDALLHLRFHVTVTALAPNDVWAMYATVFTWEDTRYGAAVFRAGQSPGYEGYTAAMLYMEDEEGTFRQIATLDHEVDESAGRLTAIVPKALILNEAERIPLAGDTLTDVYTYSQGGGVGLGPALQSRMRDFMPDDGRGEFTLTERGDATGDVFFVAPDPVRVSNGGSMTIVYRVLLHNDGGEDAEMILDVADAPERWTVRVLSPVTVPAGGEAPVLVIATIPFEHKHGGMDTFTVTAVSTRDETVTASTELGVMHTHTPQPAGHHPDLFLHGENLNPEPFGTIFPYAPAFMNTEPDHDADVDEVRPYGWGDHGLQWDVPLGPELEIGLDFDLTQKAMLTGSLVGRESGEGALLARLLYGTGGDDDVVLAEAEPASVALHATDAMPFQIEMTPTEEADYVPYAPGHNLRLVLELSTPTAPFICCPPHTSPTLIVDDFKLSLPLNEYHDRIPETAEGVGAVDLRAEGPLEREARPGRTLTFPFTITNTGLTRDTFHLELAGGALEHAEVQPAGPVTLDPLEGTRVVLGVHVPREANDGQIFEALLVARSAADPSSTAVARMNVIASTDAENTDEAEVLQRAAEEGERRSPGPGALAMLAVLALLAHGRRRGHRIARKTIEEEAS